MVSRLMKSHRSSNAAGGRCEATCHAHLPHCDFVLVTTVPDIDEDRLRRSLTALMTVKPPAIDTQRSRGSRWFGGLVAGLATVVLLAGVLTTTLVLRDRAAVSTTPRPQATPSANPSFSPESTSTATPSPVVTSAPVSYLPAVGPLCTARQLEVRVGGSYVALGNGITYLILTDRGTTPCVLRGTPAVQLLDARGRLLTNPPVHDRASGYIPTLPNGGVGLLPLGSEGVAPGPDPEGGVRGQGSLPLQYSQDGCRNSIAAIRIRVGGGIFTVPLTIPSPAIQGCQTITVWINPFQPAEYLP